jgi:glycosyltransferase involved in cell wall biosynthesis
LRRDRSNRSQFGKKALSNASVLDCPAATVIMERYSGKRTIGQPVAPSNKVILFAYYFLPDNTSGVQRAVRIAKYLPAYGFDAFVIASSHAGIKPLSPSVKHVPAPDSHAPRHQETFARIAQRIVPYNERLEWVPHAMHAARRILSSETVHAVISTSPPIGPHIAALAMKVRYGTKWIADFRDPLYGNPGRPRRWGKPYDSALERAIFGAADAIVAVTDTVAEGWMARYPRLQHKFHTIWNGFDPEDALFPQPIPIRDQRMLVHVGVLYLLRHPYRLVESLDRLIRRGVLNPETIRLCFIGPIQDRGRFESHHACQALIQQGVMEIQGELIPRAEANQVIATADFLLLIDIVNLSHVGYTVPAKLYDYVLIGRPILALTDRNSPVDRILAKCGVPAVSLHHTDTDDEFDQKLLKFFQFSSEPTVPSRWFLETFDGRRQAEMLAGLLTTV